MPLTIHPNLAANTEFNTDWHVASKTLILPDKGEIEHYVNGKHLACPMPLLKLKMALKQTQIGNHVYVTATDPNSEKDIGAFCQHLGHVMNSSQSCDVEQKNTDTIFHLLITKNC